ncbi:hypothetical protein [Clostridium sp. MD294]|uniref:hypothetical protein n=1 Tax=Clostridium sp. MD294 TaxID=97138 RepID=UPI0002CB3E24|nr:hypothetical protein [Clostridium sp. MD294]NDO46662.1 hypothetical protein [Clostridium sp. MD294]USF28905.1 hypothetical protein C820_000285 [Clostridium sp. MD294]
MKLFRIGVIVAVMLLCIPRKVQAFENTFCSFHYFHCIIMDMKYRYDTIQQEKEVNEYGTNCICNKK